MVAFLTSPKFDETLSTGNDVARPMRLEVMVDRAEHLVRPDDSTLHPDLQIGERT